ncbi:hypothetical protein BJ875DRAFT_378746 [Amylocarpus encephaloides]|uniref:ML-like domain-containing protein n=1 Tax=Amylocarpus encephaloides TaxID=45428 RepID=A0A9P7YGW1_9HELO|nr:hypothetical protein BJ875DRAFT_378746 [Amylocarpus encephaloides]
MARFPSSLASWGAAFVSSLAVLNTIIPSVAAASRPTIQATNADGVTKIVFVDRQPALFTGDFGDCMGGQSLMNLTSFDAAYYADNMTVLFNLAGTSNLRNESLMLHISVDAYGEDRFDMLWNPCNANFASLCPLNASVPIFGQASIPVSDSDVSGIPPIALVIPDFEGSAILRIFSNNTQTQIACFSAVMRNGASFSHPAAVGSVLGIFTMVALAASFATAIYGLSVPHIRTHYAHSLSVLVVFEVFQSIFFSGALSLDWPSVLPAFWTNFAWAAGMIHTDSIMNSLNSFTGVSGNASQVGGAGSSTLNLNGGLTQQIYGRSLSSEGFIEKGEKIASHIYKRAVNDTEASRMFSWAGVPVTPGLPLPGNWSGFAGELSVVGIPAANAFMTGFLWLLILLTILVGSVVAFKWILEGFSAKKIIKNDRLALFRSHWLGFLGLVVLRTMFIAFFMMMTLSLFQFSWGGKAGPIAIAVIVFLVFFVGVLGVAAYACFYRVKFGEYEAAPALRRSSDSEEAVATQPTGGKFAFLKVNILGNDAEKQSVHDNTDYTKRFGWLSARYRRTRWWFFAFWVVYQFVRACFVGGARANPMAQVIGLFIWEVIAFALIIWINPFEGARNTALAVYMLGISKIATAGLSIAFLPSLNVARIPATVIGVVIIVIQAFLTIGLLILIVLGAISSYMSLTRNREEFKPRRWQGLRMRYFDHLEQKATDVPPPPPPEPEEPKEPYFSVNTVRRAPKIEDEDVDDLPDLGLNHLAATSQHSLNRASRTNSIANSMRSHQSAYGTVPYGARVHRASWSSRDFQHNWHQDDIQRGDSPFNSPSRVASRNHNANNSASIAPLVRSQASHTILTSRKYGIATIWLAATLGSASTTRKLTKKAINDVDVPRACGTISEPDAPMALRLQSSLMYGVVKVYHQQYGYLLTDVRGAESGMRALMQISPSNALDSNAGKARPEQLVLADDPAFLPDIELPPLNWDILEPGNIHGNSQGSTQSMFSIRERSGSVLSRSLPNIDFPMSITYSGSGRYSLPRDDPFAIGSTEKKFVDGQAREHEDEPMMFHDDLNFEFDEDGNMREVDTAEVAARRAGSVMPQSRLGRDSDASGRVRDDHLGANEYALPLMNDDFGNMGYQGDGLVLPDAEAFPDNNGFVMSGGLQGRDKPLHAGVPDLVYSSDKRSSEEPSSVSVEAAQRRKKPRAKMLALDADASHRNNDLIRWRDEYLDNMALATQIKNNHQATLHAKKNAFHFVFGTGIMGVGEGVGLAKVPSSLEMFYGDSLKATILGIELPSLVRATKRSHEEVDGEKPLFSPKRPRHGDEEEIGRGFEEDVAVNFEEDAPLDRRGSVEIGREAGSALADYPSSALMPWNVSASLNSHQRGLSSRGPGSDRRRATASPLMGRGSALPGELEKFSLMQEDDNDIMYGRDDDFQSVDAFPQGAGFRSSSQAPHQANNDFELFGPAADVDTQTAGQSQWVRQALDRESNNFFKFVKNTIEENADDEMSRDLEEGRASATFVTFGVMFNEKNSAVVAAQAFYHILTLATKNRVWVDQLDALEGELGGEIRVGIMEI